MKQATYAAFLEELRDMMDDYGMVTDPAKTEFVTQPRGISQNGQFRSLTPMEEFWFEQLARKATEERARDAG